MRYAVLIALCACGPVTAVSSDANHAPHDADVAYVDADEPILDASPVQADSLVIGVDASAPPTAGPCDIDTVVVYYASDGNPAYRYTLIFALVGQSVPSGRVFMCTDKPRWPPWYEPVCDGNVFPCYEVSGPVTGPSCSETPLYKTSLGYVANCAINMEAWQNGQWVTSVPYDPTARIEIHQ